MIAYVVSVLTLVAIFSIVSMALDVRWGWGGLFDFFIYGLVALGAYGYGVLTLPPSPNQPGDTYVLGLSLPPVIGVLGAMAFAAIVSIVVGAVALRQLRQIFFAIVTFASVLILAAIISGQSSVFNGYDGLYGITAPFSTTLSPSTYQWVFLGGCFVVVGVVYVCLERLFWSGFGLSLRACREDEVAAETFGHRTYTVYLRAYAIGGAVAGLGGALLAMDLTAWNTGAWTPIETVLVFAAIVVGGSGNSRGAIVGSAIVFGAISQGTLFIPPIPGLPNVLPAIRSIAVALLLLIALRFRPQGILPERHIKEIRESAGDAEQTSSA